MSKVNRLARRIIRFDSLVLGFLALVFVVPASVWLIGHMGLWLLEKGYLFLLFLGKLIKSIFLYGKYMLLNGYSISQQACIDFYEFTVNLVLGVISYMSLHIPKLEFVDDSYVLLKMVIGTLFVFAGLVICWLIENMSWLRNRAEYDYVDEMNVILVITAFFALFFSALASEAGNKILVCLFLAVVSLSLILIILVSLFKRKHKRQFKSWINESGILECCRKRRWSLDGFEWGYVVKFKEDAIEKFISNSSIRQQERESNKKIKNSFEAINDSNRYIFAEYAYAKVQVLKDVVEVRNVLNKVRPIHTNACSDIKEWSPFDCSESVCNYNV